MDSRIRQGRRFDCPTCADSLAQFLQAFIGDAKIAQLFQELLEARSVDGFETVALDFAEVAPKRIHGGGVHLAAVRQCAGRARGGRGSPAKIPLENAAGAFDKPAAKAK